MLKTTYGIYRVSLFDIRFGIKTVTLISLNDSYGSLHKAELAIQNLLEKNPDDKSKYIILPEYQYCK